MVDPVYGAFLCFASEACQVSGEFDRWGAEYERIRTPEFDVDVIEAIAAATARSEGRTWQPWQWVRTDDELWMAYVEASAAGAPVVFYVGERAERVARMVVSTPLAARLTARVVAEAACQPVRRFQ